MVKKMPKPKWALAVGEMGQDYRGSGVDDEGLSI